MWRYVAANRFLSRPRAASLHTSAWQFSSGAAKPGWHTPKGTQRWGPEIPDKQYYWDHPTYTGFLLWIRGVRPYVEKLACDGWATAKFLALDCCFSPLKRFFVAHNPDIRLQCVAVLAFYFTAQSINLALNRAYQQLMDLKRLRALETAQELKNVGFWASESEDLDQRVQNYSTDHERLNNLWTASLAEASDYTSPHEGFEKLCSRLALHDEQDGHNAVPLPMTWRFNMIPYGAENSDAKTFPVPDHEQPHRAFALNFTYNNLAYNWGDYIDRQDNKNALMRPSRVMFTDVYVPSTK